jgi:hypothetical protein
MKLLQFLPLYLLLVGPILSLPACKKETTRGNELLRGSKECERARDARFSFYKKSFFSLSLSGCRFRRHRYCCCIIIHIVHPQCSPADTQKYARMYTYIFSHFHKVGVRRTFSSFFRPTFPFK